MKKKKPKLKSYYVIECVMHDLKKWDPKTQQEFKPKLFLNNPDAGPVMSPDVLWLESITRKDSGTFFTTSEDKALRFDTEEKADEKVTEIILELGYLPSDVVAAKMEEEVRDEA